MRRPSLSILAVAFTTACGPQYSDVPGPDRGTSQNQDLQVLNEELSVTQLEVALRDMRHFLPLCDANGYPLVGNIHSKTQGATASQFCAATRNTDGK